MSADASTTPMMKQYLAIRRELPENELIGDLVRAKLRYYPTVTREAFPNRSRITHLLENGTLAAEVGMPPLDPAHDRIIICGSTPMLRDTVAILEARGFAEGSSHEAGQYVIERAFVES